MEFDPGLPIARAGHHRTPQGSSGGFLETLVSATKVVISSRGWAQFRVKPSEYPLIRLFSLVRSPRAAILLF